MNLDITIIILASGAGRRFGGPKQLALIDGETLIAKAVKVARDLSAQIVVVTGAHADAVEQAIADEPVHIVRNDTWQEGMGSSVRTGINYVSHLADTAQRVLVTLTDTPYITADDYKRLIAASDEAPEACIAAEYNDTRGVPAIFPKAQWEVLKQLDGDKGARDFLRTNSGVIGVPIPNAHRDIDRPEDLS